MIDQSWTLYTSTIPRIYFWYPYLSHFPDICSNISICAVVPPHCLGRYLNAFNLKKNHIRIWHSGIALDKYCVTHSGYFRLITTVAFGMSITDENLLFCYGISEESVDIKVLTRNYNKRTAYNWFDNQFPYECGILDLNLPPINIDDRPHLGKKAWYNPDLVPDATHFPYKNYVSTLTNPADSPQPLVLTSNYPNQIHAMKKYCPYHGRVKIGYCKKTWWKRCYEKLYYIASRALIKTRNFIIGVGFLGKVHK